MNKDNLRILGNEKEKLAADYMEKQGYEILMLNLFTGYGEIDIVAREGEYLVFCEVKYRKGGGAGHPSEAVSLTKQKRIVKSALYYLKKRKISPDRPIRFDVVAILGDKIEIIKNAFEGFDL